MQIKICSYTNLGAVSGVEVIGHESVTYFRVSGDQGCAHPQWPKMQTILDATFHLDKNKQEIAGRVFPLLKDNGVRVISHRHDRGFSFVQVMPEDAPKTMRLLDFEENVVAQMIRMQEDAAFRHAFYVNNLQPSDIDELKTLEAALSERCSAYARSITPLTLLGKKKQIVSDIPEPNRVEHKIAKLGGQRPVFVL